MACSFNLTKESHKEFLISTASDHEYMTLEKLKKVVIGDYEENYTINRYVSIKLGSCDADFHLKKFIHNDDLELSSFTYEFLGVSG